MTIKELIDKLRTESLKRYEKNYSSNSAYALLEAWYENLRNTPDHSSYMFDRYYYQIIGMIEGLRAAFLITNEERGQLKEELNSLLSGDAV